MNQLTHHFDHGQGVTVHYHWETAKASSPTLGAHPAGRYAVIDLISGTCDKDVFSIGRQQAWDEILKYFSLQPDEEPFVTWSEYKELIEQECQ